MTFLNSIFRLEYELYKNAVTLRISSRILGIELWCLCATDAFRLHVTTWINLPEAGDWSPTPVLAGPSFHLK